MLLSVSLRAFRQKAHGQVLLVDGYSPLKVGLKCGWGLHRRCEDWSEGEKGVELLVFSITGDTVKA